MSVPSKKAFPVVVPNDDVHALAIFLSAINSDNPTVESAWQALRAAVMLADGEYLPQRVVLIEKHRAAYQRLFDDLEALKRYKAAEKLKSSRENYEDYEFVRNYKKSPRATLKANISNNNPNTFKGFFKKHFGY